MRSRIIFSIRYMGFVEWTCSPPALTASGYKCLCVNGGLRSLRKNSRSAVAAILQETLWRKSESKAKSLSEARASNLPQEKSAILPVDFMILRIRCCESARENRCVQLARPEQGRWLEMVKTAKR